MNLSAAASAEANSPCSHFSGSDLSSPPDDAAIARQPDSTQQQTLTDDEREAAIQRAGDAMQAAYAEYRAADARRDLEAATSHLNRAHRHLEQQRALILGRSREQVARMERERGLV